jgi:hypothetical protein
MRSNAPEVYGVVSRYGVVLVAAATTMCVSRDVKEKEKLVRRRGLGPIISTHIAYLLPMLP